MYRFSFRRSLLFWSWVLLMILFVWASIVSVQTASSLNFQGYTLSSKHSGLCLSFQNTGPSGFPVRDGISSDSILNMGPRWGRPFFIKHHEPIPPPPPSPFSLHFGFDPTLSHRWLEGRKGSYSNEELLIVGAYTLGRQGDWLLHVPYWLIAVVITPLWWAAILWMACRHEKAAEMARGSDGIPASTPEELEASPER